MGEVVEITGEWVAIELHTREGVSILGTVPSIEFIGQWFSGAGLPKPDWNDELRLTHQPEGRVLHTYRLGWVEVEPKAKVIQ